MSLYEIFTQIVIGSPGFGIPSLAIAVFTCRPNHLLQMWEMICAFI